MAHIIQLALSAFISSLGVQGRNTSWEAHEPDQQFGWNETTVISKKQRLQKEGNARINKVSAMKPGFVKIVEKLCIWSNMESIDTDLCMAANACSIDYADTWLSKRVY
jgi:hypothetical protein